MDVDHIENLIEEFYEKHPLAQECGSEYIIQNDKAQVDALEFACKLFDSLIP